MNSGPLSGGRRFAALRATKLVGGPVTCVWLPARTRRTPLHCLAVLIIRGPATHRALQRWRQRAMGHALLWRQWDPASLTHRRAPCAAAPRMGTMPSLPPPPPAASAAGAADGGSRGSLADASGRPPCLVAPVRGGV